MSTAQIHAYAHTDTDTATATATDTDTDTDTHTIDRPTASGVIDHHLPIAGTAVGSVTDRLPAIAGRWLLAAVGTLLGPVVGR